MTARQRMRTQMLRPHRPLRLPTGLAARAAEAASFFFLAAVLSFAALPDGCTPFGVALVGAAGPGLCGAGAMLGACFGYLSLADLTQGLRHASASILTFSAAFAFYDVRLLRRPWATPALCAAIHGFTGAVILSQSGWTAAAVVRTVLELLLTACAVWCYRSALLPGMGTEHRLLAPSRRIGLLFLLATLLMVLVPVPLYQDISPGRCLGGLVVLTCAWLGGVTTGGVLGTALGAAMDLSGGTPLYTMACAMAGLTVGLCRGKSRFHAVGAYLLVQSATLFWAWNAHRTFGILWEGLLAASVFLMLPSRLLGVVEVWLTPQLTGPADLQASRLAQERLASTANAFRTLSESLRTAFPATGNENDVAVVFDRAAGRVCRTCNLRTRCWKQDYSATFNALNEAAPAMLARGRAEAGDFPTAFSHRCFHFPAFLSAVNEELTALFYRRQYNARVRESRSAVCRQYSQLSDLLDDAAAELSRELTPDMACDRRLRQRMAELGLDVRTAVFRDSRGLLRVEAQGPGCAALTRGSRMGELSHLLGVPLRLERESRESLSLLQEEPLMAVAGIAAQKKDGETVSGDAGTYFKRADGVLYVLLCDGMGSGTEANRESSLAVRLLEQFLLSGVQPLQALATLSSALAMRGDENCGFTTVDLLQVDLFSGSGELFKLGAAPTYIKKGNTIQRLAGTALPAGLCEGEADRFTLRLCPGDTVLLVSDGICGTGEDDWLRERFAAFDGFSPKDLARALITQSPQGATDDRTALVIRIDHRQ